MPVSFSMPLGIGWTLLVVLASIILRVLFKQRLAVTILQAVAILLMGFVLLGVEQSTVQTFATTQQTYAGLIDTSQSMAQTDGTTTSRWGQLYKDWLNLKLLKQMQPTTNLQFYSFDQQLKSVNEMDVLKPTGQQSNLLGALIDVSNELPPNVPIIVFSDGNH